MKFTSRTLIAVLATAPVASSFQTIPSHQANALQRFSLSSPSQIGMVAAEPEIINGEQKPRKTREVSNEFLSFTADVFLVSMLRLFFSIHAKPER